MSAPTLDQLEARGVLRPLDVHLARRIATLAGCGDPLVLLALALASRAPASGHACAALDAPDTVAPAEHAAGEAPAWPAPDAWVAALAASPLVARADAVDDGAPRPLVLDGTRAYLLRYWRHQARVARALAERAGRLRDDVDEAALADGLARLFAPASGAAVDDAPDLQRAAAEAGVRRALTVVTGGPGTGKTTTVVRLLALLALQPRAVPLRVALAAPTGKAAARMMEAIRDGLAALPIDDAARARVPLQATTLHRLLGVDPRRPVRTRHHAGDPLACDVLVVDEVSMVDLALMARLLDALPARARLVLVGDPRQLASVEAGSVLADLCEGDGEAPVDACVVRLVRGHRFGATSGIGRFAAAVDAGDADAAATLLAEGAEDLAHLGVPAAGVAGRDPGGLDALRAHVVEGWRACLTSDDPAAMLDALERFRVLAAHREGSFGVAGLNEAIVRWLERARLLDRGGAGDGWWHGRPFLVTRNDHALELYNGDTGIVTVDARGRPRAWVRRPDGSVRDLAPARLPAHETAFAMTVHASQGSEFERVLLVLPAHPSPVLTRELLYTAATRARRALAVAGSLDMVRAAVAARTVRVSGLRAALRVAMPAGAATR